ncbi:MAG: hypothetical protein ACRDYD_09455 [Acidimicrobiales bacterium]
MPASFSSAVLSLESEGMVATLWLDRPEARNAMGPDFWSVCEDPPRSPVTLLGCGW